MMAEMLTGMRSGKTLRMWEALVEPREAPRTMAWLSADRQYRYALARSWTAEPTLIWCMLNPSTADEMQDDPTVRKCIGFAKRWGYGGICVVNLFAFRATKPTALKTAADPVGPENHRILSLAFAGCSNDVIVGWGGSIPKIEAADAQVLLLRTMAAAHGKTKCLGLTKSQQPKHPLMLSYKTERVPWP
jgi:hypothetical protein